MNTSLRFTSADLEVLPDDGKRYEIIDGDLHMSKQPHWRHQFVCGQVFAALQAWSLQTRAGVANIAPGAIFSPEDDVAPDVIWMSRARRASVVDANGRLQAAPELVVEVLSPGSTNERRDWEFKLNKLKLYAREDVQEYWIIDWRTQTVQVFRRLADLLQPAATLTNQDTLTSPLLPGFAYPVSDLWEPSLD